MPNVQHSSLASADCHEPKHVSGTTVADAGKVITPAATAGTSELRKLRADEISEGTGKIPFQGFQYWEDNTAGQTGLTGTTYAGADILTIDGLGSQTTSSYEPTGASNWWNTSTNKITPEGEGDSYIIRLDFDIALTGGTGTLFYTVALDIGGSIGVVYQTSEVIPKATSFVCRTVMPIFVGSTFVANGGAIKIWVDGSSSAPSSYDVTNKGILIERVSRGS